jgi:glycosyltransferase involved in cell wall biosynthesis
MKILIFTESLTCGGKERRVLELIQYLKENTDHEITLVITESYIHYDYAYDLGVPIIIIERKGIKYDPRLFAKFYKYCSEFKPDIIHSWGRMTTFYSIPTKVMRRIPLISSMIYDAQIDFKPVSINHFFFSADIFFSDVILSNSYAGLTAYKLDLPKTKVIWNGVHLERFQKNYNKEEVKEKLNVKTEFIVVMLAAFSTLKDYDLFLDVAKELSLMRNDVTFLGVGDGPEWKRIQKRILDENIPDVILTGQQKEVENIIAASDIGILCTYSEGISNSIIESMALGIPVISTDLIGGSKEIIIEGETGYCVERDSREIVNLINKLLNNNELRLGMGTKAKERINTHFSIQRMGEQFERIYNSVFKPTSTRD